MNVFADGFGEFIKRSKIDSSKFTFQMELPWNNERGLRKIDGEFVFNKENGLDILYSEGKRDSISIQKKTMMDVVDFCGISNDPYDFMRKKFAMESVLLPPLNQISEMRRKSKDDIFNGCEAIVDDETNEVKGVMRKIEDCCDEILSENV